MPALQKAVLFRGLGRLVDRIAVCPSVAIGRLWWVRRFCGTCLLLPQAGCGLSETLVKPPDRVTSVPQRDLESEKTCRRKGQMFKMLEERNIQEKIQILKQRRGSNEII